MKTLKKILIILCVVIITIGMFFLGKEGLNYSDGYTQDLLLETAQDYLLYAGIATAVILLYLVIRYNKQGVAKVATISILGIIGTILLILAIMAMAKIPTNRVVFPIMLLGYISSIVVITYNFEKNS